MVLIPLKLGVYIPSQETQPLNLGPFIWVTTLYQVQVSGLYYMAPRAWSILDAAAYYALCTSMWRYGSIVDKYRASEALIANPFTYRL